MLGKAVPRLVVPKAISDRWVMAGCVRVQIRSNSQSWLVWKKISTVTKGGSNFRFLPSSPLHKDAPKGGKAFPACANSVQAH